MVHIYTERLATLRLNTTPEHIACYLLADGFPDNDGYSSSSVGGCTLLPRWFVDGDGSLVRVQWHRYDREQVIDLSAYWYIYDDAGERPHGIHVASGVPLRVRLVSLGEARTEVRLTCVADPGCQAEYHKDLRRQLLRMVHHLAEMWPEVKGQLAGVPMAQAFPSQEATTTGEPGSESAPRQVKVHLALRGPTSAPEPWDAEWHFEIQTESPVFFWNRVVFYISRHERKLQTARCGPLELIVPELRKPDSDIIDDNHTVLAWKLDTITPETLHTDEEIAAFFDPERTDGPRTLPLAEKAPVFWCSAFPVGAQRTHVWVGTRFEEATAYVIAMLEELARQFPELRGAGDRHSNVTSGRDGPPSGSARANETGRSADVGIGEHPNHSESRRGGIRPSRKDA